MSRNQQRLLDAAVRAFPRARRERDGEMISDLAAEMVASGKPVSRQAASIVIAGLAVRLRGFGATESGITGQAFMVVAGFIAPVLVVTTVATLASTLFLDYTMPDNRLGSGVGFSAQWLFYAGIPWSFSVAGCALAAVGFSKGEPRLARIGSALAFSGAWLVVGSMGGWMPGPGFVGPAELPFDYDASGATSTVYIVAPIGAMTTLMLIASILMRPGSQVPVLRMSTMNLTAVAVLSFAIFAVAVSTSYLLAGWATNILLAWILVLPLQCLVMRRGDLPVGVKPLAVGIELVAFSIPFFTLLDQIIDSMTQMGTFLVSPITLTVVAAMAVAGIITVIVTLLRSRQRA